MALDGAEAYHLPVRLSQLVLSVEIERVQVKVKSIKNGNGGDSHLHSFAPWSHGRLPQSSGGAALPNGSAVADDAHGNGNGPNLLTRPAACEAAHSVRACVVC